MAPNNMAAITFTYNKPPGSLPVMALAKSMSRLAIPPLFIISPAKIKNGMASKAKLSSPTPILWAMVVAEGIVAMVTVRVRKLEKPKAQATGTPIPIRIIKLTISISMLKYSSMV